MKKKISIYFDEDVVPLMKHKVIDSKEWANVSEYVNNLVIIDLGIEKKVEEKE